MHPQPTLFTTLLLLLTLTAPSISETPSLESFTDPKQTHLYPPHIRATLSKISYSGTPKYKHYSHPPPSSPPPTLRVLSKTCETSWVSPFIPHSIILHQDYKAHRHGKGYACHQSNTGGSKCTTVVKFQSTAVGICSEERMEVGCDEVVEMVGWVVENCRGPARISETGQEDVKAGGRMEFEVGDGEDVRRGRVVVFHAPVW